MTLPKPVDRRIQRTKIAIREALITLIKEKGFDALLVSDIAERANINRGTFYLHYQDKFDLLDKTETEIVEDVENIIRKANTLNLADFNSIENPIPVLVSIFEYFKENARLMQAVFSLEGGTRFQAKIRKAVEENLKIEFITGLKESKFLVPSHYLVSYSVSAHMGVVHEWLMYGCVESPREMAIIISKISWYGIVRSTGFV